MSDNKYEIVTVSTQDNSFEIPNASWEILFDGGLSVRGDASAADFAPGQWFTVMGSRPEGGGSLHVGVSARRSSMGDNDEA